MTALPSSWATAPLGDVASVQLGKMLDRARNTGEPTPYLRNINVRWGSFDLGDVLTVPLSDEERRTYAIRDGDLMACEGGEPGRCAVWRGGPTEIKYQKALHRVRLEEDISPELLALYLRHLAAEQELQEHFTGTTIKHLPRAAFMRVPIPIPPLAEQRRIVAKLDRLSARSAAAREHLARTQTLAARAKQATLAAAFRGDLTAEWRDVNGIVLDHARATEAAAFGERERLEQKNRTRRGRKSAPDHHRTAVALDVPNVWCLSALEKLSSPARLIQYGILKPGPDQAGGIPYVKVLNIRDGVVNVATIRHTTHEIHKNYARSSLREGDLLLTIRGTVGRLAFAPVELHGGNITQDTVRIDILHQINPVFVFWYLHSPCAEQYFRSNEKGVAVRGINVGDVRPMEVPLPSREEQNEIVRRIEAAFARIDRLAAEAARAAHLLDRLDERLLARAFRGELVPQDPADEPAQALLARIRAARAAAPKPKRARRRAAP